MAGSRKDRFSQLGLLKPAAAIVCAGILLYLSLEQYKVFKSEPAGTSLTRESMDGGNLPFPAVTMCDPHFKNALAFKELGLPKSPFGPPTEVLSSSPSLVEKLLLFELDVVPNLWRYFFTLDDVIFRGVRSWPSHPDKRCRLGKAECVLDLQGNQTATPDDPSQQEAEFTVGAGKWRSRFFFKLN